MVDDRAAATADEGTLDVPEDGTFERSFMEVAAGAREER